MTGLGVKVERLEGWPEFDLHRVDLVAQVPILVPEGSGRGAAVSAATRFLNESEDDDGVIATITVKSVGACVLLKPKFSAFGAGFSPAPWLEAQMVRMMGDISEECWSAGWMSGIEDDVWSVCFEGASPKLGQGEISESEIRILQWLFSLRHRWPRWNSEIGEAELVERFAAGGES